MIFKIIKSGVETTLQDAGRPGHRAVGIPQSGAADRLSFAVANHLAGNKWNAPALEIAICGLEAEAVRNIKIAIAGADMTASCGDRPLNNNQAHDIKAGQIIRFGYAPYGARTYLAAAGGCDGLTFAGSRSTYIPAAIGGIAGRALKAGDCINSLNAPTSAGNTLPRNLCLNPTRDILLRVQKGPEFDSHLSATSQRRLFTEHFTAGPLSNRMGMQLSLSDSAALPLNLSNQTPLTSSPLLPGSLQITSNGTPILSGIDSHCTGGYVRALIVIPADHWLMGQIAPGSRIYFRRVRTDDAKTALARRNMIYAQYIAGFRFD